MPHTRESSLLAYHTNKHIIIDCPECGLTTSKTSLHKHRKTARHHKRIDTIKNLQALPTTTEQEILNTEFINSNIINDRISQMKLFDMVIPDIPDMENTRFTPDFINSHIYKPCCWVKDW